MKLHGIVQTMPDVDDLLELDEDALDAVKELQSIRDSIKSLKGREETIKAQLLETLNEADSGVDSTGRPIVEVRRQQRSSVDTKKLQALYPDVWADCQRETLVSSIRIPSD